MRHVLLPLYLVLTPLVQAEAQKKCSKGIPCGNTCISADKICRIGASRPSAAPTYVAPIGEPVTQPQPGAPAEWVGLVNGRVYYRASCQAARELPEPLHRFRTEAEAQQLGYRRSKVPGC
jgi:hypothetical protein